MHIEILVEDQSTGILLEHLAPKFIGPKSVTLSWRLHPYKGIGRIPAGIKSKTDANKRILLDQLPRLLAGYAKTPGVDAVIVILDVDKRDCNLFLQELKDIAQKAGAGAITTFRLAIEETEAWYFGDLAALQTAYRKAKIKIAQQYVQDSQCGTWEKLADCIYSGGLKALKKSGAPPAGKIKCEWAEKIGPLMDIENNQSPSFQKLRDGLRRLVAAAHAP